MAEPDVLVFHDETGSTHPNNPFAQAVGLVRRDRAEQLLAELACLRTERGCRDSFRLKWNRCGDGQHGRSARKLGAAFLDWYELRGYALLGFEAVISDRRDPRWSDVWVRPGRDFQVYNTTAASAVAHAISYLAPHRPADGIVKVRMFSDYRRRAELDDFRLELPVEVHVRCRKANVQFVDPVWPIGAASDRSDPEIAMAFEILQYVDFLAGAAMACWNVDRPIGKARTEFVRRVSAWHHAIRAAAPTGRFSHLKRSFEILASPGTPPESRTRFFTLPHLCTSLNDCLLPLARKNP